MPHLAAARKADRCPWSVVREGVLHQASYAHAVLDRFGEQATQNNHRAPGSLVHVGPAERMSAGPEENAMYNIYCQQA